MCPLKRLKHCTDPVSYTHLDVYKRQAPQYNGNSQSQPLGQQNNGAKPSFIPTEVPSSEPNSDTVTFTEAEYSEPTEPQYADCLLYTSHHALACKNI